jgi:hypothetical protein
MSWTTDNPGPHPNRPMPDVQRISPPWTNRAQELVQAFREAVSLAHHNGARYAAEFPNPLVSKPHRDVEDADYNCDNEWCLRFWAMVREAESMSDPGPHPKEAGAELILLDLALQEAAAIERRRVVDTLNLLERTASKFIVRFRFAPKKEREDRLLELEIAANHARTILDEVTTP